MYMAGSAAAAAAASASIQGPAAFRNQDWLAERSCQACHPHAPSADTAPHAAYLSGESQSLLKALLQREAPKRLGYGEHGSAKVMAHPFFRSINWKHLLQQQVSPLAAPTALHARWDVIM